MVINPIVGVYIPIIRIPYDHPQYKEFRPWHISLECLEKHSRTLANLSSYESVYTCFFFSFQLVKKRGPGWTPVIQKSTHETCHSMVFQNIFHRFHRHQRVALPTTTTVSVPFLPAIVPLACCTLPAIVPSGSEGRGLWLVSTWIATSFGAPRASFTYNRT